MPARKVPTHLKLLRGNPGRRPLPRGEPKPKGNLFEPPAELTESQKESWTYAIANAPAGLLKRLDRGCLVGWVAAEDMRRAAMTMQAKLDATSPAPLLVRTSTKTTRDKAGNVVTTEGGSLVQSPYVAIINKQTMIMARLAAELGFSPASRTRVSLGAAPDEAPDNAFAEF